MKYKTLQGDQAFFMIPTSIQSMMSGAIRAGQNKNGLIRLDYTDGSTEQADCSDFDIYEKDFFGVVSAVQTRARK